jgi:hypothetical protein
VVRKYLLSTSEFAWESLEDLHEVIYVPQMKSHHAGYSVQQGVTYEVIV